MTELLSTYGQLDTAMRFYWVLATTTSVIFLIQMALTFIGLGDTDASFDFDTDVDTSAGDTLDVGGALQLFSVRNIINFLLGLGWGGVCLSSFIENRLLLALAAILTGVVFVVVFFFVLKKMRGLESNGAFQIKDCVGQVCDVYLRIPAARSGQGKVQVSFSGSVQEIAAVTDGEAIPSGTKVSIAELVDEHTVRVEL